MKHSALEELKKTLERYKELAKCESDIVKAFEMLKNCYEQGNTVYLCGNGGSASDCEHIAGELMKSFKLKRALSKDELETFQNQYGEEGEYIAQRLQKTLRTISLVNQSALGTAYINDVCAETLYAQLIYGYGIRNDVMIAISTSGNSKNIIYAVKTAKILGLKTIGLTGDGGGELSRLCDVCIKAPASETYVIQEYHLPIYHTLCLMLEAEFFDI